MAMIPNTVWAPDPKVVVNALAVPHVDDPTGWGTFGVWINLWIGARDWEVADEANGILITEYGEEGETVQVHVVPGEYVVFYPDGTLDIFSPEKMNLLYRCVN